MGGLTFIVFSQPMLKPSACYHEKPQFKRVSGLFREYVPVFLAGNICVLNQSGRKGARNYSRTFGRIEVPRRARIV